MRGRETRGPFRRGRGAGRAAGALAAALFVAGIAGTPARAQDEDVPATWLPPREIADAPTAGLVPRGSFETRTRIYPGGGVELRIAVGLFHWIHVGGAYGGLQLIGDGKPEWNPRPGLEARVRLLEETYGWPAVAIGIDTQGSGFYDEERRRYQFKSRGVYAVVSKNYAWLGDLTLHGGGNRSLEDADDGNPTAFGALDKSVGPYVGLGVEYDVALNDDREDGVYGKGRGYLNAALRVTLAPEVEVRFVLRDLLRNTETVSPEYSDLIVDEGFGREAQLSYRVDF